MDAAWVGVIGGAVGGLTAGGVSIVTQMLSHSHQSQERDEDRQDAKIEARRADFAAALEATARLRAAVVEASLEFRRPVDGNRVEVAQPVSAEAAAQFVGSIQRLHLHGVEVDVEAATEMLFDYMTRWPSERLRMDPDELLRRLADVARLLGEAYRATPTAS